MAGWNLILWVYRNLFNQFPTTRYVHRVRISEIINICVHSQDSLGEISKGESFFWNEVSISHSFLSLTCFTNSMWNPRQGKSFSGSHFLLGLNEKVQWVELLNLEPCAFPPGPPWSRQLHPSGPCTQMKPVLISASHCTCTMKPSSDSQT